MTFITTYARIFQDEKMSKKKIDTSPLRHVVLCNHRQYYVMKCSYFLLLDRLFLFALFLSPAEMNYVITKVLTFLIKKSTYMLLINPAVSTHTCSWEYQ